MTQQWIGIGVGHGSSKAERALTTAGFKCSRQSLLGPAELKVLVREDTTDRTQVEEILRRENGKDAWISPVSGTPTHSFSGYREGL
ncbi:hypothetical protein ACNKF0_10510 [Nocardioides sp. T5]|uniref:hypothetical protein n=1 Tax=Nocardioides sp. T5 TaxID=3400182 RepID=UPI003A8989F7